MGWTGLVGAVVLAAPLGRWTSLEPELGLPWETLFLYLLAARLDAPAGGHDLLRRRPPIMFRARSWTRA